jgi:HTH-like domain
MKAIEKLYTKYPFYGGRRIAVNLPDEFQPINLKKVRRLMNLMNIEAIYPKQNLSAPDLQHKTFPYLLRRVKIERVNQRGLLLESSVLVSMDGKGRALDNIFIERFWRTIKYESDGRCRYLPKRI